MDFLSRCGRTPGNLRGHIAVIVAAVLAVGSACLAGPPAADLPDVKVTSLSKQRPRLVFKPDGQGDWTFARLKKLYKTDSRMRELMDRWLSRPLEKDRSPAASAIRYRLTGDEAAAERAIEQLQNRPMEEISFEYYSDGWEFALAYDWLYDHPSITRQRRAKIEGYLVANARRALELLQDESWDLCPSLWHGRTKIANLAMVVALSLETAPQADELRQAIVPFFADGCRALRISEGWPEGYAYWLGNRSFPFALAVDCWRTATGRTEIAGIDLIEMIRRTDLWHVYGLRPDDRLLLYGDVFHGVQLDYGLRAQTMDYYARITRDPRLQAYALYAHEKLDDPYSWNNWTQVLAFDPTLPTTVSPSTQPAAASADTKPKVAASRPARAPDAESANNRLAAGLEGLPLSDLFGAGAYNLAIFRTGWRPDSTVVSFRAGGAQVHHQHYNAGAFTIFKEAPLAILSGTYAGFGSEHRQMYYIRSVAANCPLVLMPGEQIETRRHYDGPFASAGGQRVVIPNGSDIMSTAWWRRESQPGRLHAAGQLSGYAWQPDSYGFVGADLTCAYNSTQFSWPGQKPKIRRAARALVWLPQDETVLVYDRITATSAEYQKKWLLHTMNQPQAADAKVLKGDRDNGILAAEGKDLAVTNGRGAMAVQALLPAASRWLLIGGPDYRYYVETDGDQSDGFDGINAIDGQNKRGYFDNGDWRAELEPTAPAASDEFLVAMVLGTTDAPPKQRAKLLARQDNVVACQVGRTVVVLFDAVEGDRAAVVEVEPAGPVERVVACVLTEPEPVPVDAFEPVRPAQASAAMRLPTPLPAGKPVSLVVRVSPAGEVTIATGR